MRYFVLQPRCQIQRPSVQLANTPSAKQPSSRTA